MARGLQDAQVSMLAFIDLEERIPRDHPIRAIRRLANTALADLSPVFDQMYAVDGRPSVPPERLLKGDLLISLYSLRGERALCEALPYNLLFRWFLGMNMVEPVFDASTFSKNRARLLEHEVARRFFDIVVRQADAQQLLSNEHFTVDGTLIEAAASLKRFRPSEPTEPVDSPDDPGNPTVNFRGEQRRNATHASTTDPESRLAKKSAGKEAKLSYAAHALMENRHGLLVDLQVSPATGKAERESVPVLLDRATERGFQPATLGADKGYDTIGCVDQMRSRGVAPHVTRNIHTTHRSAVDDETVAALGYALSQKKRKLVEEAFGWGKTVGGLRRTRYRGLAKVRFSVYVIGAAYNLVRMSKLMA